jgi:hypothetical protein
MARLTGLLRDLIELTGEQAGAVPVLELQLEDIVTRASALATGGDCLLVTAWLPPCDGGGYAPPASAAAPPAAEQEMEYLWHADEGRHIAMRRVPIKELPDERSVMDAILTTWDLAAEWLDARRGDMPVI